MSIPSEASKPLGRVRGKALLASAIFLSLLLAAMPGIQTITLMDAAFWDGGVWSPALASDIHERYERESVVYRGMVYVFTEFASFSTDDGDDAVSPDEYTLYDLEVSTFDGLRWTEPAVITDPDDDRSEGVKEVFVHDGMIYVILTDRWKDIPVNRGWNSSASIMSFDGTDWSQPEPMQGIRLQSRHFAYEGGLSVIAWNSSAPVTGMSGIYDFSAGAWTRRCDLNASMAGGTPVQLDGSLVFVWEKNIEWGQSTEVWLREWDGANWSEAVKVSPPEYRYNWRPCAAAFEDGLLIVWEGHSEEDLWIWMRTYRDGKLSAVRKVSPWTPLDAFDCQASLLVIGDKAYISWQRVTMTGPFETFHTYVRAYDGEEFGTAHRVTNTPYHASDYPLMLNLDGDLVFIWQGHPPDVMILLMLPLLFMPYPVADSFDLFLVDAPLVSRVYHHFP